MISNANLRIKQYLSANGISVTKLAKMIDASQPTVNRQLSGESALTSAVVESVCQVFPELSAEWLLRGEGEMLRATITNTFLANYGDRAVQVSGNNSGNISTGDAAAELEYLRQQLAEAREEIKKKDECIYKLINAKL